MAATTDRATLTGYAQHSNFIGGLLRSGLISKKDAQLQLVAGFWDCERQHAESEGLSLDHQVAEYIPVAPRMNAPVSAATAD